MFTGIVEETRRGASPSQDLPDAACSPCAAPLVTERRAARRLDRGQRRLPDRRRRSSGRRVHRRRGARDARAQQPRQIARRGPGQPGACRRGRRGSAATSCRATSTGPALVLRPRGRTQRLGARPHRPARRASPATWSRRARSRSTASRSRSAAVTDDAVHGRPDPDDTGATTLGIRTPGDTVNIEVDVVAKYVERLATPHWRPRSGRRTMDAADDAGDQRPSERPRRRCRE